MYFMTYYMNIMQLRSRNDSFLNFKSNLKIRMTLFLHRRLVWTPFLVQFIYIFPLLNGDLDFKDMKNIVGKLIFMCYISNDINHNNIYVL